MPSIAATSSASNSGGASSVVLSPPSGSTAGDVLLAVLAWNAGGITAPGGWVELVAPTTSGTLVTAVYARVYDPGDSTYTWAPTGSTQMKGAVCRVAGADTDIDAWQVGPTRNRAATGTNNTNNAAALTAEFAGGLAVTYSTERTTATETDVTSVTGADKVLFVPQGTHVETITIAAHEYTGTSVASVTITYPNTQASNGLAGHIVIPAGEPVEPPTTALEFHPTPIIDSAPFRQWTVGQIVDRMALGHYVVMAHRGGGDRSNGHAPEFSEYAYDLAVGAGRVLLELSLGRTSDGVWFGLHDQTIDRVTGTTGNPNASAMTWAEVSAFTQSSVGGSGAQPFARFDDLMSNPDYAHCVWMVDPKYELYAGRTSEFLDMLDANGGPDRFIVKFWGVGSTEGALATAAKARGYLTWGYYYEADITDGDVTTYQGNWDWLAMEYQASQDSWNAILAYGKPVLVDPVTSVASGLIGLAKGAAGIQLGHPTAPLPSSWLAVDTTIDTVALTQHHQLAVADVAVTSTVDVVTLTQHHALADVGDVDVAVSVDELTLTQHHGLAVDDLAVAVTVDAVAVVQHHTLTVEDVAIAVTVDGVSLVQHHQLSASDLAVAVSVDSVTLAVAGVLAVADARTTVTVDAVTLVQHHQLAVDDVNVAVAVGTVSLSADALTLTVADLAVSASVDQVALTQHHTLGAVGGLRVAVSVDTVVFSDGVAVVLAFGPLTLTRAVDVGPVTVTPAATLGPLEVTP